MSRTAPMDQDAEGLWRLQHISELCDRSGGDMSRVVLTDGSRWRHAQKSDECDGKQLSGGDKCSKY